MGKVTRILPRRRDLSKTVRGREYAVARVKAFTTGVNETVIDQKPDNGLQANI